MLSSQAKARGLRTLISNEKYVKDNLLYVTSDWTKCLCSRCTAAWKRRKEIAEVSPDFGKRLGFKMVCIDEFHDSKKLDMKF